MKTFTAKKKQKIKGKSFYGGFFVYNPLFEVASPIKKKEKGKGIKPTEVNEICIGKEKFDYSNWIQGTE